MRCYSNSSNRPHRRRRTDRSIVFAGWRQCATTSNIWFLGPARVCRQTASRSDHLFLQDSQSCPADKHIHRYTSSRCYVDWNRPLCYACGMVWYGMVNVDLYSAIITKVSNALDTLVSVEKPGFQTLSSGREFQTKGPCTANARRPTVVSRCRGTTISCCVADLRRCLPTTSVTGVMLPNNSKSVR